MGVQKLERSPIREVDFVAERLDGQVIPVEVKFRKRIDEEDLSGLRLFQSRYQPPISVVVTREASRWDAERKTLYIALENFLLAF